MRAVIVAGLCIAASPLGACVSPGNVAVDPSFQVIDRSLPPPPGPGRLVAYLKAQSDDGLLSVCGVFLFDGVAGENAALSELGESFSYIEVAGTPLRIGTKYFPRYPAPLDNRALADVVPPAATCEKTAADWTEDLASAPLVLHLVPYTTAPKQLRIPATGG